MLSNKVIIALKLADNVPSIYADYIGCDKGALFLAEQKKYMVAAIGDFDSINESDFDLINKYSKEIIKLNPIKDISDSEAAINLAIEKAYNDIILLNGFGKRFDHTYVNLSLLKRYKGLVSILDKNNYVKYYSRGEYKIEGHGYKYVSFFSVGTSIISLSGFKYDLNNYILEESNVIGLSNEIISDNPILKIQQGGLLVMLTKD